MYIFISILILIVCILLGLIVLVQNPKGGGLAANFGGGNQFMGARQTADFLEKASWTLAVVLLLLSLTATMIIPRGNKTGNMQDTELQNKINNLKQPAVDFQAPPMSPATQNNTGKTTDKKKK
jgi:preprotein translocase subunit SecG